MWYTAVNCYPAAVEVSFRLLFHCIAIHFVLVPWVDFRTRAENVCQ